MTQPRFNEHKFKELLLYVAFNSVSDSTFGATKLNKILCFSDFIHFGQTGSAITGADYQKLPYGPAPRVMKPMEHALVAEGSAYVHTASFGYEQQRLIALREPDLSLFNGTEIALVDRVMEQLKDRTATAVSDLSHRWLIGWEVARQGETIRYESVYWQRPKLTPDVLEEGKLVAKELGGF